MAKNKIYTVMKNGEELEQLKTLATAKKLADAEGAEVYADGKCVYQGIKEVKESEVEKTEVKEVKEVEVEKTEVKEAEVPETKSVTEEKPHKAAEPVTQRYRLKMLMNVRKRPSMNASVLATKAAGTIVHVVTIENDWMQLRDGTFILYGNGEFAEKL